MWVINISADEIKELPPKAAELLANFLTISDGSLIHPNDSKRFYEFIRHCHARRVKLTSDTLNRILTTSGCSEQQSKELSTIYYHGRRLLKVNCPTFIKE